MKISCHAFLRVFYTARVHRGVRPSTLEWKFTKTCFFFFIKKNISFEQIVVFILLSSFMLSSNMYLLGIFLFLYFQKWGSRMMAYAIVTHGVLYTCFRLYMETNSKLHASVQLFLLSIDWNQTKRVQWRACTYYYRHEWTVSIRPYVLCISTKTIIFQPIVIIQLKFKYFKNI